MLCSVTLKIYIIFILNYDDLGKDLCDIAIYPSYEMYLDKRKFKDESFMDTV